MKAIFLTNMIAPYRVDLFNDLEVYRAGTSFDFEVYFMCASEKNRSWDVDMGSLAFKHEVGRGLYVYLRKIHHHFNPVLVVKALNRADEVVLGASWNNFNVLVICVLKRLRLIRCKISVWTEANYLTTGAQKKNKFRDMLRKFVFESVDGRFVVPGEMSKLSLARWGIEPKRFVTLPNLVSSSNFSRKTFLTPRAVPTLLIVARLEEQYKGILNFMEAVGAESLREVKLKIAGEGSSKPAYVEFVKKFQLENHVEFLGNVNYQEMGALFASVDMFVLPSFSDPSPLTVIEACRSGLPMFISNRCGNHFEAVKHGENGFIFDPMNKVDIRKKFDLMLSLKSDWQRFSERSMELADEHFDNETVLKNLIASFSFGESSGPAAE